MGAVMAAVAGIMVALSVDELMPLAKEIDPQSNPSYGVLWDVGDGVEPGGAPDHGHWLKRRNNKAHAEVGFAMSGPHSAGFALMFATIGHQIFNRDYRHIVLLRERDALRRARHGAIVVGQFTQHACRFKASQGHQVDSRFGVTAAGQHAARLRAQREDMARTVEIGRFRAIGNGCAHGGHGQPRTRRWSRLAPLRWSR
jgi:hypothetical protein